MARRPRRARKNIDVNKLRAARQGGTNPDLVESVLLILALLRALKWRAWTAHWKSEGPNFYGDHLLLERLYAGDEDDGGPNIDDQIDGLGERIVDLYGADMIHGDKIAEMVSYNIRAAGVDGIAALLYLESRLQEQIAAAVGMLKPSDIIMDNFLRTIADERSVAIYLLKRRAGR